MTKSWLLCLVVSLNECVACSVSLFMQQPPSNITCHTTGAASQAMLYFLKQMHNRDRERLERGQVAFDLKAVHVIEAAVVASPQSSNSKAPQQLVVSCHKAGIPLHVIPLEAVFLPVCEPIPNDASGCCPSLHHLQPDLHRLLQVNRCDLEQDHLFIAIYSKPHKSMSRHRCSAVTFLH